jgi:hypothetical protein
MAGAAPAAGPGVGEWTGTITYSYVNGVLLGAPQISAHSAAALVPRLEPAPSIVTVHHGHTYSATVTLKGFEVFASNGTVADTLTALGFTRWR